MTYSDFAVLNISVAALDRWYRQIVFPSALSYRCPQQNRQG